MASIQEIWLLAKGISKAARKEINAMLRPLDLGSSEASILLHMAMQDAEMNQDQLGEMLDITKAAISRLAESLEHKAYILRSKRGTDKRYHWLSLTEKGKQALPRIQAIYGQVFDQVLQTVEDGELDALAALLGRIAGNLAGGFEHAD